MAASISKKVHGYTKPLAAMTVAAFAALTPVKASAQTSDNTIAAGATVTTGATTGLTVNSLNPDAALTDTAILAHANAMQASIAISLGDIVMPRLDTALNSNDENNNNPYVTTVRLLNGSASMKIFSDNGIFKFMSNDNGDQNGFYNSRTQVWAFHADIAPGVAGYYEIKDHVLSAHYVARADIAVDENAVNEQLDAVGYAAFASLQSKVKQWTPNSQINGNVRTAIWVRTANEHQGELYAKHWEASLANDAGAPAATLVTADLKTSEPVATAAPANLTASLAETTPAPVAEPAVAQTAAPEETKQTIVVAAITPVTVAPLEAISTELPAVEQPVAAKPVVVADAAPAMSDAELARTTVESKTSEQAVATPAQQVAQNVSAPAAASVAAPADDISKVYRAEKVADGFAPIFIVQHNDGTLEGYMSRVDGVKSTGQRINTETQHTVAAALQPRFPTKNLSTMPIYMGAPADAITARAVAAPAVSTAPTDASGSIDAIKPDAPHIAEGLLIAEAQKNAAAPARADELPAVAPVVAQKPVQTVAPVVQKIEPQVQAQAPVEASAAPKTIGDVIGKKAPVDTSVARRLSQSISRVANTNKATGSNEYKASVAGRVSRDAALDESAARTAAAQAAAKAKLAPKKIFKPIVLKKTAMPPVGSPLAPFSPFNTVALLLAVVAAAGAIKLAKMQKNKKPASDTLRHAAPVGDVDFAHHETYPAAMSSMSVAPGFDAQSHFSGRVREDYRPQGSSMAAAIAMPSFKSELASTVGHVFEVAQDYAATFAERLKNDREFRASFITTVVAGAVAAVPVAFVLAAAATTLPLAMAAGAVTGIVSNYAGAVANAVRKERNNEETNFKSQALAAWKGAKEATTVRRLVTSAVAGAALGGIFHGIHSIFSHGASASVQQPVVHTAPAPHVAAPVHAPDANVVAQTLQGHTPVAATPAPAHVVPAHVAAPVVHATPAQTLADALNNAHGVTGTHYATAIHNATSNMANGHVNHGLAQIREVIAQMHKAGLNADASSLNKTVLDAINNSTVHAQHNLADVFANNQPYLDTLKSAVKAAAPQP